MADKTLLEYWFILYKRKLIILTITLSAMITAGVLSKILSPVYEAKAVFFVPKEPDVTTFFTSPGEIMARSPLMPSSNEEPHGPYIGILKSQTIASLVQKDFPHKTAEALMRRDMDFVLSDEYMLEVYARDKNPRMAADIANAYVKYFKQLMGEYSLKSQSERQATLEEDIARYQKSLSRAKGILKVFQQKNRTANLDEEIKQLITMKTTFESQLETSQALYNENKNKILTTKRKLKDESVAFNASELIITSPLLEKLRAQLVDIESKMAALRVEIKETHPDYMILKENYEEVAKNINKEIEVVIKSQVKAPDTFYENLRRQATILYVDGEGIKAAIRGNKKTLKGIEGRILEIPKLKYQLDTLITETERYRKLVELLRVNLAEVKAQERMAPQVAVLVDEATPPKDLPFPFSG
ncbi:MAG: hypothetical protein HS132_10325 [Planctomycetia bacterium]|nr:hypothetical protein [Planctomycetia bacterium]